MTLSIKKNDARMEANRLAWSRRFQNYARLYWHQARGLMNPDGTLRSVEEGQLPDFYMNAIAKRNYHQARVAMEIEEDELLW